MLLKAGDKVTVRAEAKIVSYIYWVVVREFEHILSSVYPLGHNKVRDIHSDFLFEQL